MHFSSSAKYSSFSDSMEYILLVDKLRQLMKVEMSMCDPLLFHTSLPFHIFQNGSSSRTKGSFYSPEMGMLYILGMLIIIIYLFTVENEDI